MKNNTKEDLAEQYAGWFTTNEEKIKAITELEKEQWELLKKSLKIAKLKDPKRWQTSIVRAIKIFNLTMQAKQIQSQKKMIASQPTPKFPI